MPFSLFQYADALGRHTAERRARRRLADVQTDRHLAQDLGLPFRPYPHARIRLW